LKGTEQVDTALIRNPERKSDLEKTPAAVEADCYENYLDGNINRPYLEGGPAASAPLTTPVRTEAQTVMRRAAVSSLVVPQLSPPQTSAARTQKIVGNEPSWLIPILILFFSPTPAFS
jgi:hypothetical protein